MCLVPLNGKIYILQFSRCCCCCCRFSCVSGRALHHVLHTPPAALLEEGELRRTQRLLFTTNLLLSDHSHLQPRCWCHSCEVLKATDPLELFLPAPAESYLHCHCSNGSWAAAEYGCHWSHNLHLFQREQLVSPEIINLL